MLFFSTCFRVSGFPDENAADPQQMFFSSQELLNVDHATLGTSKQRLAMAQKSLAQHAWHTWRVSLGHHNNGQVWLGMDTSWEMFTI